MEAYAVLVDRYRDAVVRLAYVFAGDEAEDVAQEAFVQAHRALGRFRPGAPFRPWLLTIAANEARNRRRAAGRRLRLAATLVAQPVGAAAVSAEDVAVAHAQRETLLAAVEALPDRDRQVVACRYLAGLSEAETVAVLGWPAGTVKSRLSRALDHLRATLDAGTDVKEGDRA